MSKRVTVPTGPMSRSPSRRRASTRSRALGRLSVKQLLVEPPSLEELFHTPTTSPARDDGGLRVDRLLTRLDLRRERIIAPVTAVVLIATNAATVSSVNTVRDARRASKPRSRCRGELRVQAVARTARAPAVQRGRRVVARRAVHDRGVGGVRGADGHLTRKEELGGLELVRAGRTGRLAPLTAAVIVALDSR